MNRFARRACIVIFIGTLVTGVLTSPNPLNGIALVGTTAITMMLILMPFAERHDELAIHYNTNMMLLKTVKDETVDFGFQLFNLRPQSIGKPGYVYVLLSDKGFYKIGKTTDPANRKKTFDVRLPMHVDYLVVIKSNDMSGLEKHLHQQFSHKHQAGEWYRLVQSDLTWLSCFPGAISQAELDELNGHAPNGHKE